MQASNAAYVLIAERAAAHILLTLNRLPACLQWSCCRCLSTTSSSSSAGVPLLLPPPVPLPLPQPLGILACCVGRELPVEADTLPWCSNLCPELPLPLPPTHTHVLCTALYTTCSPAAPTPATTWSTYGATPTSTSSRP